MRSAARAVLEGLESRRLLTTYTVTSNLDTVDPNDGALTLREAITSANTHANSAADPDGPIDKVAFNIPGAGVQTIDVGTTLEVTDAILIDGYTQPGASRNTKAAGTNAVLKVELNAGGNRINTLILDATAGGSTVSGLAFGGAGLDALVVEGSNNVVAGNYFGLDATGKVARNNDIDVSVDASDNLIGGTDPGARNVMGNTRLYGIFVGGDRTRIQNNYFGTDASGTVAMPNGTGVLLRLGSGHVVGGTATGEGNLISGNGVGVKLLTVDSSAVQGNLIGTDVTGKNPLANSKAGVVVEETGHDNLIGGTTPAAGNLIAYNGGPGVDVQANSSIGFTPLRNAILSNAIYRNKGLGIDLATSPFPSNINPGDGPTANDAGDADTGPNGSTNFPYLTSLIPFAGGDLTIVTGQLQALPDTQYLVQFFTNPSSESAEPIEGHTYVGRQFVTTDASGNAAFSSDLPGVLAAGDSVSATATIQTESGYTDTSEFSAGIAVGAALPKVSISGASEQEGDSGSHPLHISLAMDKPVSFPVTVHYHTEDGTATAGSDYEARTGTITFNPTSTGAGFGILVKGDTTFEPTETFKVVIDSIDNGDYAGAATAVESILNDDPAPPVSPKTAILQAEDGTTDASSKKLHTSPGFKGSGYVDLGGAGGFVQFSPAGPHGPASRLSFRYSNGEKVDRPVNVTVDGVKIGTLKCPPTGGSSKWETLSIDAKLTPGAHAIRLVVAGTAGPNVDQLTITPLTPPAAPTGLKTTAKSKTQVELKWTDASNNETGFRIRRSTSSTFSTFKDFTVGANVTSFLDTTAAPGTTYFYEIEAFDLAGPSAFTTPVVITMPV